MADRARKREGWYTDPLGQADLRWFDSQNWTEHVKSAGDRDPRMARATSTSSLQWADADEFAEYDPAERAARVSPPPPPVRPTADPQYALFAAPAAAAAPVEEPVTSGPDWSELALALLMAGDDIVRAKATGIPELTIDMVERTFWWASDLDSFPAHPVDLRVRTTHRNETVMPLVAGRYIEPLLWRVGTGSFADIMFKRVDPTLRYKLRRWPDLTAMPHTADQLRVMNMLANAQLTPAEIVAVANVSEREVKVLISTFALMSLLDVVKDPAAAARER